jgi:hypothetical protein
MIELKNSKKTYLGKASGGERYSLDAFIGAVQMREPGGEWQDIRPQLVRDADGWRIEGAPYYAEIKDDGTRLFCPDRNEKSRYLRLPSPVYFATLAKNPVSNPTRLDKTSLPNQITIPTDWGEYRIIFSNTGMHFEVLFTKAPPSDVFGKDSPRLLLDIETSGFDIEQLIASKTGLGIPRPRLVVEETEDDSTRRYLDWVYKNGQLELGFDFGGLLFPVLLKNTTIDDQIEASTDDADERESDGTMALTGTELRARANSSSAYRYWLGLRWDAGIPQGATIDAAYVEIYNHSTSSNDVSVNLHFEKAASPATFDSGAGDITGRSRTSSSVSWVQDDINGGSPGWVQTPSLVTPLHEVIDSYTVTQLALIGRPGTDVAKLCVFRSYDYGDGSLAARLHIEFTEGGGATEKTAAETGSGADGSALLAAVTKGETGGGTEAGLSLLAGLTKADAGSGTEQSLLSFLLTSFDSGAGIEAVVASLAELMKGDSSSDTEGISGRGLVLPDSGNGNDIILALIAAIAAADNGSGIEQSVLSSIVARIAAETGGGADAAEIIAGMIANETGLGSDAGVIIGLKQLLSGDGGISIDALKALIGTSKTGLDMKLPGRAGHVRIPSRGVSL